MNRRICIDLNGVLDTYQGWQGTVTWHSPRPGAREFLHKLRKSGFEIVVLSARDPEDARQWLAEHGMIDLVDLVTDRKVAAHAYVDDRAICFRGDFDETLAQIVGFTPHWQRLATDA